MRRSQLLSTALPAARFALCALVASGLMTAPAAANAAPTKTLTVAITAQVELIDDPFGILCETLQPGEVITGTYTYTLGTPDSNGVDFVADYFYTAAPNGISLNLGGAITGTDPGNTLFLVEIVDDYPSDGSDNYLLRSYNNVPLSCGSPVTHIAWQLDDPTGDALQNTALPKKPPHLSDFQSVFGLTVEGRDPSDPYGRGYFIRAHVTSATLVK